MFHSFEGNGKKREMDERKYLWMGCYVLWAYLGELAKVFPEEPFCVSPVTPLSAKENAKFEIWNNFGRAKIGGAKRKLVARSMERETYSP